MAATFAQLAPWTRWQYTLSLRWWCDYLQEHGAQANLAVGIPARTKPQARQVVPTPSELERLLALAAPDERLMLLLCSQCGMRSGEAVRFAPCDLVDGEARIVGKCGNEHRVPVAPAILALLRAARADPSSSVPYVALLARQPYRNPMKHYHVALQRLRLRAGLERPIRYHDLRRLLARQVYATTGSLAAAQSVLGHRSLSTTLGYLNAGRHPLTLAQINAAIGAHPETSS